MINRTILSSEDADVTMTNKIKTVKVSDFEGKDITLVTGQLKVALMRLAIIKKLPEDSEKRFSPFINRLPPPIKKILQNVGLSLKKILSFIVSYDKLLTSVNTQYREMIQIITWKVSPTDRSHLQRWTEYEWMRWWQ